MRQQIELILFGLVIVVLAMLFFLNRKSSSEKEIIVLPKDNGILAANDSIKFQSDPFSKSYKVAILVEEKYISILNDFKPYIEKYPEIPFIFYINSANKSSIINSLSNYNFPVPVFIYFEKSPRILFVSYILNEKNELIELTNPSLPGFEACLKRIAKK